METTELIRLVSYILNTLVILVLSGYFFREYLIKKLRASLAWGIGFLFLGIAMANLTFMATVEVTRPMVLIGGVFTATMIALLYYGASLLFFREGSFFREKMAIVYFALVLIVQTTTALLAPADRIAETVRGPTLGLIGIAYLLIAILFYQVSRRLSAEDPRRRTITLVSAAWVIIFVFNMYLAFQWGEQPTIESIGWIIGSFGWFLLLYGMTTGKTTRT